MINPSNAEEIVEIEIYITIHGIGIVSKISRKLEFAFYELPKGSLHCLKCLLKMLCLVVIVSSIKDTYK